MPNLKSEQDREKLSLSGIRFSEHENALSLQPKNDILNRAIEEALHLVLSLEPHLGTKCLDNLSNICEDTCLLILDLLQNQLPAIDPLRHYPLDEYSSLARHCIYSRVHGLPLSLVSPVCPDYSERYQLDQGIGSAAQKLLAVLHDVSILFSKRNFDFHLKIHLADVEAFDPNILKATCETHASFLLKLEATALKIKEEVRNIGFSDRVEVTSMNAFFEAHEISYSEELKRISELLLTCNKKKVVNTLNQLYLERKKQKDIDLMQEELARSMVVNELAGYTVYGNTVQSNSVILSPDALSALPAYNFLKHPEDISPVIFIKHKKGKI